MHDKHCPVCDAVMDVRGFSEWFCWECKFVEGQDAELAHRQRYPWLYMATEPEYQI